MLKHSRAARMALKYSVLSKKSSACMRPICSAENPVSSSRRLFHRRSRPCLSTRQYAPGIRSSQPRSRSDTAGRTTSPPLPSSPACLLSLTLIQFILVKKPRQNPNRPQHHIARKEHSRKRPTSQNRTDDQLTQNGVGSWLSPEFG